MNNASVATTSGQAAVEATVRDYFEGWFTGDPGRMEAALHPALVKRSVKEDGPALETLLTAQEMIRLTKDGRGMRFSASQQFFEIDVNDIYGDIANVTVRAAVYREYLHLARVGDRWRITHALWAPVGEEA